MAGDDDKKRKLEMTLAVVRGRFGVRAVRRLGKQDSAVPHVATGFPALDEVLGTGGLPRGRMTEIVGVPTSGMATLALKVVAQAQADEGGAAVYVDPGRTFDPDYAARCGVALDPLLLVRPAGARQALAILQDVILDGRANVLIFDLPFRMLAARHQAPALSRTLARLLAPLGKSACALVFLTSLPADSPLSVDSPPSLESYPAGITLPHCAAVRLLLLRERWLYRSRDICGYQAQVHVLKNKFAPAGKRVTIDITFNGVVAGDST